MGAAAAWEQPQHSDGVTAWTQYHSLRECSILCVSAAVNLYARLCVLCPCRHLRNQLSEPIVHELVAEAVELEREFICEALQVSVLRS